MGERHKYDDIIHEPWPRRSGRARMSMADRGAQFSPFAALTGFDSAIDETARLTDSRIELTEGAEAALNQKLQAINACLNRKPAVAVTYFLPDERKDGGTYIHVRGKVQKMDSHRKVIQLSDGLEIMFSDILEIELE